MEEVMVPAPETVSPLVLTTHRLPLDFEVIIDPALESVLLLTFMVRLLSLDTVTSWLTLVAALLVVVVTVPEPPVLRFRVVVDKLVANVRA